MLARLATTASKWCQPGKTRSTQPISNVLCTRFNDRQETSRIRRRRLPRPGLATLWHCHIGTAAHDRALCPRAVESAPLSICTLCSAGYLPDCLQSMAARQAAQILQKLVECLLVCPGDRFLFGRICVFGIVVFCAERDVVNVQFIGPDSRFGNGSRPVNRIASALRSFDHSKWRRLYANQLVAAH